MEQINLQQLIEKITPLYNSYKQFSRTINGTDALVIMWSIGDILKIEIERSNVSPHGLYRKIYGKAEGKNDITQKSYITREFLGRSYRIRNIFRDQENIRNILPNLRNFISFREAMPFFDNKKYLLKGEERKQLLAILNSNEAPSLILKKIKLLQQEKIGIKNPRNQKLNELESYKETFIAFYNYLFNLLKIKDFEKIKKEIPDISNSTLNELSINTSALTQEGLKFIDMKNKVLDPKWEPYFGLLEHFALQNDAKERRRFRRLISPERISRLAEMLEAVNSADSFKNFRF